VSQVVLITGASGGIGSSLAVEFAKNGYAIVIAARKKQSLQDLKKALSIYAVDVNCVYADLTELGGVASLLKQLKDQKLEITVLVNNAGFGEFSMFEKTDTKLIMSMVALNVNALTELTRILLPDIIRRGGGILNVASVAGFMPGPMKSVYFATKAYVLSFSLGLREELLGRVNVSVLCPGPTKSKFWMSTKTMKKTNYSQLTFMSSEKVARVAVRGYLKNKAIITPGLLNKINTILPRFIPLPIMARAVRTMFKFK
jgi:short-subunit dehydrogenase